MQEQNFYSEETEKSDEIVFREVIEIALSKWYWFVVSLVVCVTVAWVWLEATNPTYRAEALVLIKNDKKGASSSETAIFADMGLLGNNGGTIENEMYVLKSADLMSTVVKRLNLDVNYSIKSFFKSDDLYAKSPVMASFPDKEIMRDITIRMIPKNTQEYDYQIIELNSVTGENTQSSWTRARFEDTVSVNRGRFVIGKTALFDKKFIDKEISISLNDFGHTVNGLLQKLNIKRPDKIAQVLSLTVDNSSLLRASDIINTLIEVYNEDVINDKNRVATNTEKFIVERIASISKDLDGIDGRIEQLKKENNIIDFSTSSGVLIESGAKYKEEVVSIETEIRLVEFVRDYLVDPAKKNELVPANTGISDGGIEDQIKKYNEERLRLNKIQVNSGTNNPVTTELQNTLNVTKTNMIQSIDNWLSSLKIKLRQSREQEKLSDRRISNVPTQEKFVNDVVRQQKIKEELYLYLLNKREENALNLAITESNAKVIEKPNGSRIPVAPNALMFLALGFIAGLLLPLIIILIYRLLDMKIHSKRDIENAISVPVLGELPSKMKHQKTEEIIISDTGRDRVSEAFRVIRSNMDFIVKPKKCEARVIQLTSTTPGEGKTYVTVNLALSCAQVGKRVLIIDLDLRKGQLSKVLIDPKGVGMSNYLSGMVDDVDEIINKGIENPNLDFISRGALPPNPVGLLMSDRFGELIESLKGRYDYIFMDTVPAMVVADAAIVNHVVDITIYVMRNGVVDKRYLTEIEKMHTTGRFKNMTILISDVDTTSKRYGYGYGYGYGNDEK